ncbi:flavin reductase [Streptomyces sp. NBC_01089]|uniref:flavin reductase n=1 Tax=Streptomyces sp. NBC_01089 TaxID=2903747 RepID=UPI00386342FD|nr:flavin reductase [Streptomyces sp. NBC_01089]
MTTTSPTRADFREAMAHLPAAVNILTTDGAGGRCGITVSAVCSVTDSPPTVLVCVNRSSATHDLFSANSRVCLNVLGGEHEELALHFSGATKVPMAERFSWDIWEPDETVPVLRDALVSMVGTIRDRRPTGSHTVMFVETERITIRQGGDSLVYFNRRFHRLDPAA